MLERILRIFRRQYVEQVEEPKPCYVKNCGQTATRYLRIEKSRIEDEDGTASFGTSAYVCDDPTHAEEAEEDLRGRRVDSWPVRVRSSHRA